MNHEDELMALIEQYGEANFKAGALQAQIARHVSMIAILKDAQPVRQMVVGPSPGPLVVQEPPAPRFSKPRVALPRKNGAGDTRGTSRRPVFDPHYRPTPQSPMWVIMQAVIAAGGGADRRAVYDTVRRSMPMSGVRFNNQIGELRRRAVLKGYHDSAEGMLEWTDAYRDVLATETSAPSTEVA